MIKTIAKRTDQASTSTMKAAAQRALLSLERRNKASNVFLKKRFSLVKQLENERDKMETRLDDARVKWSEDDEYETVEKLSVANVNVPENYFHMIENPTGYKGKRDQKHVDIISKWQRNQQLRRVRINDGEEKPTIRMLRLSRLILEALNAIVTHDLFMESDPNQTIAFQHKAAVLRTAGVTFVEVSMSRDLLHATCTWECRSGHEIEARNALSQYKTQIRQILTERKISVKYSPKLIFKHHNDRVLDQNTERLMDIVQEEMRAPQLEDSDISDKASFYASFLQDHSERQAGGVVAKDEKSVHVLQRIGEAGQPNLVRKS